jgi:hypothetical protein
MMGEKGFEEVDEPSCDMKVLFFNVGLLLCELWLLWCICEYDARRGEVAGDLLAALTVAIDVVDGGGGGGGIDAVDGAGERSTVGTWLVRR